MVVQGYCIVGYLIKNNFDSMNFDLDGAERLVETAKMTLTRDKLSKEVLTTVIKVVGILAGQSLMTLKTSQEFFLLVSESKLLTLIAGKFSGDKEVLLPMFECLVKFIHPSKGETPIKTTELLNTLT